MRLGMFDPPEIVPYSKIDEAELDSAAHRQLARQIANESMVLLKNDGVLPLKSVKRIAIVGPLADQTAVLLGNYNGTPTHTVRVLEGMKAEFPDAKITYVAGTQFLSNQGNPVPESVLTTLEGKPGLKAEYSSGSTFESNSAPLTSRVESVLNLNETNLPEQAKATRELSVRWIGLLAPTATGDYLLGIKADGHARVSVEDRQLTDGWGNSVHLGQVHLEKGHPVKFRLTTHLIRP
jgi:beta-glucosidase